MDRGRQFAEGYDRAKDWELDYPNENRRYTVVTHHGDPEAPTKKKTHFNTFEQARSWGLNNADRDGSILPNNGYDGYTEKDGFSQSVWTHRGRLGVILKSTKVNGRWRPARDGDAL